MSFSALHTTDRTCANCGYDYVAHKDKLACPSPFEIQMDFVLHGHGYVRQTKNIDKLKQEFLAQFTIMGGGNVLDEITQPEALWQWIVDNFELREK